jgi:hypothetical protein
LPSDPGQALHQNVPTVLFVDPTWPLKEKMNLKEEEQDEVNSYVPLTGSKNLLSYSSKQEEEDDVSTMMPNEQRDPFKMQASAVKALMYGEDIRKSGVQTPALLHPRLIGGEDCPSIVAPTTATHLDLQRPPILDLSKV